MDIFVYILRCSDGSYYVGSTRRSLEQRVAEHNAGTYDGYTKQRRPVTLVYHEPFTNAVDAIRAERQLKGWSRAKKEALIRGDIAALPGLSKRRKTASSPFETAPVVYPERRAQARAEGGLPQGEEA